MAREREDTHETGRWSRAGAAPALPLLTVHDAPLGGSEEAEARVGQVLAKRYRLEVLVGSGGAGAVYAALDLRTGFEVAIKVLHDTFRASKEQVARFLREARATSRIGHSSVVSVLDVGRDEADGSLFMVMELLRGEPLFWAIERGHLDDAGVVEVARQLLGALGAAHRSGIVHRDVKPENVFLTWDPSGNLQVKLIDFGIAKYLRPELSASSFRTMDGLIMGTPHYMSPEACMGQAVDEHADLWSAAAAIFHAFAGVPPFDDGQIGRLLMRIVSGHAPSLRRHRPDLPLELTNAIDRALMRDRAERWPDVSTFVEAIERGGRQLPRSSRPMA
jgi:serine/threonine-protein kinase